MTRILRQVIPFLAAISLLLALPGTSIAALSQSNNFSSNPGQEGLGKINTNIVLAAPAAVDVQITVDRSNVIRKSVYSTGMTHIDDALVAGDPTAITNVKNLLKNCLAFQNTYSMGWGISDPWPDPSASGPSNWGSLDQRINMIRNLGGVPIITLMNAPWWMKGQLQPDGSTKLIPDSRGEWAVNIYSSSFRDFRGITYPAGYVSPDPASSRVLDSQMSKWLLLVRRIAERYMVSPYNVRYFQVWNELKGYANPGLNKWDYEIQAGDTSGYKAKHGYTYMYNQVYNVLRNVATEKGIDPNSIQIGGPYAEIKTWTASGAGGFATKETLLQNKPYGTYDQRDLDVVKYWLKNKTGAGFIALDLKNRNRELTALVDPFTANNKFTDVVNWIRSLDSSIYPGAKTMRIISSEWYANPYNTFDRNQNNAVKADGMIKFIKAGGGVTLPWGGAEDTTSWKINPSKYTDPYSSGGGQALPWYPSYKAFKDYFSSGTSILATTQTTSDVSVLASPSKTMLVNKKNSSLTVSVNGVAVTLSAWQVRVIDTP